LVLNKADSNPQKEQSSESGALIQNVILHLTWKFIWRLFVVIC